MSWDGVERLEARVYLSGGVSDVGVNDHVESTLPEPALVLLPEPFRFRAAQPGAVADSPRIAGDPAGGGGGDGVGDGLVVSNAALFSHIRDVQIELGNVAPGAMPDAFGLQVRFHPDAPPVVSVDFVRPDGVVEGAALLSGGFVQSDELGEVFIAARAQGPHNIALYPPGVYGIEVDFGAAGTVHTEVPLLGGDGLPQPVVTQTPVITGPLNGAVNVPGDTSVTFDPVVDGNVNAVEVTLIENGIGEVLTDRVSAGETGLDLTSSAFLLNPSAGHSVQVSLVNSFSGVNGDGVAYRADRFTREGAGFTTEAGALPAFIFSQKVLDTNDSGDFDLSDAGVNGVQFNLLDIEAQVVRTVTTHSRDFVVELEPRDHVIDPRFEAGLVLIEHLAPGQYTLEEVVPPGAEPVSAVSVPIIVGSGGSEFAEFLNRTMTPVMTDLIPDHNLPIEPAQNPESTTGGTLTDGGGVFLATDEQDPCPACETAYSMGFDPVFLHSGEAVVDAVDLSIPGVGFDFNFARRYRSGVISDGLLGQSWTSPYLDRNLLAVDANNVEKVQWVSPGAQIGDVLRHTGLRADVYAATGAGDFAGLGPTGFYTELNEQPDGSFVERDFTGNRVAYASPDANGVSAMTAMTDSHGNTMSFEYDAQGRLERVIDTMGRPIDFAYNGDGLLAAMTDFVGRSTLYEYDLAGDLVAVTTPTVTGTPNGNDFSNGKRTEYTYSSGFVDPRLNHNLLAVTAPNETAVAGPPRVQYTYDTNPASPHADRVIAQTVGGINASGVMAGGVVTYDYQHLATKPAPDDFDTAVFQVMVTDPNGNINNYQTNQLGNLVLLREYTNRDVRPIEADLYDTRLQYNTDGEVVREILPEGNTVDYTYDSLSTSRFAHGNVLAVTQTADPDRSGDQSQLTTVYTYEPVYQRVRSMTDPRGFDADFRPAIELPSEVFPNPGRYTTVYTYDYQEGGDLTGLAAELGVNFTELTTLFSATGTSFILGDVNNDGRTDQIAGDLIRVESPIVNVLPGSHIAAVEGDTTQEITDLFAYNDFGQLVSVRDAEFNVSEFEYFPQQDPNGDGVFDNVIPVDAVTGGYLSRRTADTVADPLRNSGTDPTPTLIRNEYEYDAVGNVTRFIDGRGIATDFVVNELNQVVEIVRAADHNVFGPDPAEPQALTDFAYRRRFFYDSNNNIVREQVEDRGDTSGVGGDQARPGDANLDGAVDLDDAVIVAGNFLQPGNWARGDFDLNGIVDGLDVQLLRDNLLPAGPAPETFGGTAFVDYVYDYHILDQPVRVSEEVSDNVDLVTRYRYDPNGNRVLTILPEGNANTAIYDERDLLFQSSTGATDPPPLALLAPGDPIHYDVRGGSPCLCSTFHYDGNRNIIETVDSDDNDFSPDNNSDLAGPGDRTRFVYDGFDRLTSTIDAVANQSVHQYDPASNTVRISQFGAKTGISPQEDGQDVLPGPVSIGGEIQFANLVVLPASINRHLLESTEFHYDELTRLFQTDRVLFVNTIGTSRAPDVTDGAIDLGKANLTPGDDQAIAGIPTSGTFDVTVLGRVTTLTEFDRNTRLVARTEDDGDTWITRYDGVNRVVESVDPEGNTTEYAYDDNHNQIERRETDVSQVPGVADEVFVTTYFYDSLDRLTQDVDNIGESTAYRYDSRDNLVAVADAQGPVTGAAITRRAFTGGALTVDAINDFGNVTRYFYDGIGRRKFDEVVLTASGSGDGVNIGADVFGVKTATPTPDANQGGGDGLIRTGYTYDDNSLTSALLDDQGNVTVYLYDNLNRNVTETKGATVNSVLNTGNVLRFPNEIPFFFDDTNGAIPGAQVDAQLAAAEARIDQVAGLFPTLADQAGPLSTTIYAYDRDSNLRMVIDENGTTIDYDYDGIGRRTDATISPGTGVIGTESQSWDYDGLSRLVGASDDNGGDESTVTFAYDSLSRVIEETLRIGFAGATQATSTGWRADGLRSSVTYPNGRVVEFTYDGLDRVDTIGDQGAALPIADYDYIGTYRVLERVYAGNGTRETALDDDGTINVGYDGLRRATQLRHLRNDDSLVVGFTYGYDRADNRLSEGKLHDTANSELYAYDSAYRLTSFTRPDAGAIAPGQSQFTLDGTGNWQEVDGETREHSTFNEVTVRDDGGVTNYSYDDNGNLTGDGTRTYEWDSLNRLKRVTRDVDSMIVGEYAYDALNRRVERMVTNSGALDGTTRYYYDGNQVIEERDAGETLNQQYVYGVYVDEVLVLDRNLTPDATAIGAGDQRLYYHTNAQFSVHAVTDDAAVIVEGYQYDAYGRQTVFTPGTNGVIDFSNPGSDDVITLGGISAVANPYLYTGRRLDAETGLYYYRNRYQSPELGRFISRDPLGYHDGPNLYEYVAGSPTNSVDPLGLKGGKGKKAPAPPPLFEHQGWTFRSLPKTSTGGGRGGQTFVYYTVSLRCVCKDGAWHVKVSNLRVRTRIAINSNLKGAKKRGKAEGVHGHEMQHVKAIEQAVAASLQGGGSLAKLLATIQGKRLTKRQCFDNLRRFRKEILDGVKAVVDGAAGHDNDPDTPKPPRGGLVPGGGLPEELTGKAKKAKNKELKRGGFQEYPWSQHEW